MIVILLEGLLVVRFGFQLDKGFAGGPAFAQVDKVDAFLAVGDVTHGEEARHFVRRSGKRKPSGSNDPIRHLLEIENVKRVPRDLYYG